MKKIMKRAFAAVIVAVMLLCAAPLSGIADFITTAQAAGGYKVGDTIYFGSYPQRQIDDIHTKARILEQTRNDDGTYTLNGTRYFRVDEGTSTYIFEIETIAWRILAIDSEELYVLSEFILDSKPYNTSDDAITWADSSIRKWLNSEFINHAFTSTEK